MATFNPSSNSHDWQVTDIGPVLWGNGDSGLFLGRGMTSEKYSAGFHFPSVTIPQGSTISSAKISCYLNQGPSNTVKITWTGEDIDNASPHTQASHWTGASKTSATIIQTLSDTWTTTSSYEDSVDIKTIIQEIVNRGGWSSGNAINILAEYHTDSLGNLKVNAFAQGNAAKLEIVYQQIYSDTGSGGARAGGSSIPTGTTSAIATGGAVAGGTSTPTGLTNLSFSGGAVASGTASVSLTINAQGGARLGGSVTPTGSQTVVATGGARAGGAAVYFGAQSVIATGGVVAGTGTYKGMLYRLPITIPAAKVTQNMPKFLLLISEDLPLAEDGLALLEDLEGNEFVTEVRSFEGTQLVVCAKVDLVANQDNEFHLYYR